MTAKVYAKSGNTVNMREKQDKASKTIVQVPIGATVEVMQTGPEWSQISYGKFNGYMMTQFLKLQDDEDVIYVSRAKLEQIYKEIGELLSNK